VATVRPGPGDQDEQASTSDSAADRAPDRITRLFGSRQFFRLWIVQVTSATGDWLGFSAIIVLAARIGGEAGAGAGAGAISLVLAARIVPGFFFGPLAGVLVDRWDRKRVMMACDLGRALVIVSLPFVHDLAGLVVASLVLEALTLLWSPAKDASVPKLVSPSRLASANSLSLAAAYGTFPFAALLFAFLAAVSGWLGRLGHTHVGAPDQMALAFYVDGATFVISALLVRRLQIGRSGGAVHAVAGRFGLGQTLSELREGWQFIFINPTVRAVNIGLATGLIGGGMLVPLGAVYSADVLHAGAAGYGLFTTALGFGVAIGAVAVVVFQRRLPKERIFTGCLLVAGAALIGAATAGSLLVAALLVGVMGAAVGPVYVVGFVLLQEEVDDELRGRVFASLNTLVRLCVLLSMVVGPLLAALLGGLSDRWLGGRVSAGAVHVALPGVRLTLWLGGLIIISAGALALHSVRAGQRSQAYRSGTHPSQRVGPGRGGAWAEAVS
jgi:dTMP kinase